MKSMVGLFQPLCWEDVIMEKNDMMAFLCSQDFQFVFVWITKM